MTDQPKTVVSFKTSQFNTSEPKDYFINPCCFGDDVALWLKAKFTELGIETSSEPGQEDFGWYLSARLDDDWYCLVIGYRPGDTDAEPGDWVIWIEKEVGFVASLFGGRNKNISRNAVDMLNDLLKDSSGFSDIRWYSKSDFDKGEINPSGNP